MDPQERIAQLEQRIAEQEAALAEKDARIAALEQQVAKLTALVAELTEAMSRNSRNSNLPPSSDGPGARAGQQHNQKGQRNRGGQPGHGGSKRELLPPEQVDEIVDHYPANCENCHAHLPRTADDDPVRHQTTEVPRIEPHTTEHRRHAVTCLKCDHRTRAALDAELIPASPFGPRLMSIVALLTGVYHLSRRKAVDVLSDILGVEISLGAVSAVEARVSEAVAPAVEEAWQRVAHERVKHADGTSWLRSGATRALWTIASAVATVFKILPDGCKETLAPLFGDKVGILVSDRATALNFWAMERRQICWAHLLRKFISFSEGDGPAGAFGRELLDYAGLVFDYWHEHKAGVLTRSALKGRMAPVRVHFEALLVRAANAGIKRLSGSCADIQEHKAALWTFVDSEDVEPTNNHAERELRAFVLWRKRSFGAQSDRGDHFAERLMSVAHTARKQRRNVLEFIEACCMARREGLPPPSLFTANARAT